MSALVVGDADGAEPGRCDEEVLESIAGKIKTWNVFVSGAKI